jgi:hypothetical protein
MTPSNLSVVVLGSAAALVSALMLALDRRSQRRNLRGACAGCATLLLPDDSYRIDGRVYCARCASRLRVRLTVAYLSLAVIIVLAALLGIWGSIGLWREGDSSWWLMGLTLLGSAVLLFFAGRTILRAMRDRNRFAEELERARLKAAAFLGEDE